MTGDSRCRHSLPAVAGLPCLPSSAIPSIALLAPLPSPLSSATVNDATRSLHNMISMFPNGVKVRGSFDNDRCCHLLRQLRRRHHDQLDMGT